MVDLSQISGSLDQQIEQTQRLLAQKRQELADLIERGLYRVQFDNGQTIGAQITGDELRFDPSRLSQA